MEPYSIPNGTGFLLSFYHTISCGLGFPKKVTDRCRWANFNRDPTSSCTPTTFERFVKVKTKEGKLQCPLCENSSCMFGKREVMKKTNEDAL